MVIGDVLVMFIFWQYYQENAEACSHHGTYKCGICECLPGAFGRRCECTSDEISHNVTTMDCIQPNSPNGLECSGKGQCICGRCDCETRPKENEVNIFTHKE